MFQKLSSHARTASAARASFSLLTRTSSAICKQGEQRTGKLLHGLSGSPEGGGHVVGQCLVIRQDLLQPRHPGLIDIHGKGGQEFLVSHNRQPLSMMDMRE